MTDGTREAELERLRRLLVGAEQARLDALDQRLDAEALSPERLAAQLPEAITLRAAQDKQLARALAPTVEGAISESVRRKPTEFADAIFPVLGPAIRKAIAETMSELVGSINRAMQHSFSARGLSWRFESWRTGVPYAQVVIKHALVYRVEQVFLVHKATGLLLQQAHPPNLEVPDADLVSGMLTAIRDFVGDSFQQEKEAGGLRTFSVGELTVMVEPGPHALLAAVVRGQAPEHYVRRLQEAIEGIHAQFSSALIEYDGDTALFETAKPLLEDCLVTVLDTDEPAGAKANVTPYIVGAALLVAAFIGWRAWVGVRFERGVAALRATPGLMVVNAERGWRTHAVRGLRDPDAPWPGAVLARAGVDTTRVWQAWEPYVSLQPALVIQRVQRALGPGAPPTSQLSLVRDTLVVRGAVDAVWLASAARRVSWPAGVTTARLSGATVALPSSLSAVADSLASGRVLFAAGSSELDDAGHAVVRTAAAQVNRVASAVGQAVASATGAVPGTTQLQALLSLTGRADSTGDTATNAALSRARANVVQRALEAALRMEFERESARRAAAIATAPRARMGAAPAPVSPLPLVLDLQGVGTTAPLAAPDSAARARVNRSVSFGISLQLVAPSGARP